MRETAPLLSTTDDIAQLVRVPRGRVAAGDEGGGAIDVGDGRPVNALPLLLAGPILRWVSDEVVKVWVCTSAMLRVRGTLVDPRDPSIVLGEGSGTPVMWGRRCFTTMVTLRTPSRRIPRGVVLGYDLEFSPPRDHLFTDRGGLLPALHACYPPYTVPTFVHGEAGESRRFRFAHGSCRKPHALGRDAMLRLDADLGAFASGERPPEAPDGAWTTERPRALFLTGDQIYADDVHGDMVTVLQRLAPLLLGFEEVIPALDSTPGADGERPVVAGANVSDKGPGARLGQVRSGGLTVDAEYGTNHLLGLGEFLGMYALSWGRMLWRDWHHTRSASSHAEWAQAAGATQRAMANVPVYMARDDHEVTDDWPMFMEQWRAVRGSPVGRWITSNGLAAFWIMQAHGSVTPRGGLLEQVRTYLRAGWATGARPTAEQRITLARAASTFGWNVLNQVHGFTYTTPTSPPVLMLDTRTERELFMLPTTAMLMNDRALRTLADDMAGRRGLAEPTIVVSPGPVLGHSTPETVQHLITLGARDAADLEAIFGVGDDAARATADYVYMQDCEAWGLNERGLLAFVGCFAGLDNVIFLSGDVHYGHMNAGRLRRGGRTVELLQLTSSPIKNPPEARSLALDLGAEPVSITEGSTTLEHHMLRMGSGYTLRENHYATVDLSWSEDGREVWVSTVYRTALGANKTREWTMRPR
jgi:hypothetical protein